MGNKSISNLICKTFQDVIIEKINSTTIKITSKEFINCSIYKNTLSISSKYHVNCYYDNSWYKKEWIMDDINCKFNNINITYTGNVKINPILITENMIFNGSILFDDRSVETGKIIKI
ncbi:MAG: hypothetical protein Edafosvirus29_7 [Edafosvirus sp.]|uniref:Uncharacterized protein n=1 Tax=Edafosvirus sp. TaxID=2487765 RepID=A0A3G4ZYT4_9VIRU|nr:MAG: hypothetical protein Edafosvirus29_7 [Edafosvirus sp.]